MRVTRRFLTATVLLMGLSLPLRASEQAPTDTTGNKIPAHGDCGLVYGDGHALTVCAPPGWVLDNTILNEQGVYAVFYPLTSTWDAAREEGTFMYVNTVRKGKENSSVAALMKTDAEDTMSNAEAAQVSEIEPIRKENGDARVQQFKRGAFGRYEAVAYLDSPEIIVMFVITSRTEEELRRDYPAFKQLVNSYKFLTTDYSELCKADGVPATESTRDLCAASAAALEVARVAVEINMATAEGKHYDSIIGMAFGEKYGSLLGGCAETARNEQGDFDIYLRLSKTGTVQDVLVSPATKIATCLRQQLRTGSFAPPPKPSYWVDIHMTIAP